MTKHRCLICYSDNVYFLYQYDHENIYKLDDNGLPYVCTPKNATDIFFEKVEHDRLFDEYGLALLYCADCRHWMTVSRKWVDNEIHYKVDNLVPSSDYPILCPNCDHSLVYVARSDMYFDIEMNGALGEPMDDIPDKEGYIRFECTYCGAMFERIAVKKNGREYWIPGNLILE